MLLVAVMTVEVLAVGIPNGAVAATLTTRLNVVIMAILAILLIVLLIIRFVTNTVRVATEPVQHGARAEEVVVPDHQVLAETAFQTVVAFMQCSLTKVKNLPRIPAN